MQCCLYISTALPQVSGNTTRQLVTENGVGYLPETISEHIVMITANVDINGL